MRVDIRRRLKLGRSADDQHHAEHFAVAGGGALLDRLVRHCRGLAAGEEPADDRRERRHAEEDEEEVRDGNVPERGDPPFSELLRSQPIMPM